MVIQLPFPTHLKPQSLAHPLSLRWLVLTALCLLPKDQNQLTNPLQCHRWVVGSVEIASNTGATLGCMELWDSVSPFATWKVTHFTSTAVFEGSQGNDSYVHASHFTDVESEVHLGPRVLNPSCVLGFPEIRNLLGL